MNEQTKAMIIRIFGALILILVVSGCVSSNQPLDPTETLNLQTRLAQITLSQTPTLIPSYTPDPNATQFQPGSLTPTPTPPFFAGSENSLFPIPNRPSLPSDYSPTPIPTPNQPLSAYRLKEWDQENALQLIQLMDSYSYDAGVTIDYNHSLFPLMQRMVNLSGEEFLYRFPNSIYSEDVVWKTALSGLHFRVVSLLGVDNIW
jgi:hypothetical protein